MHQNFINILKLSCINMEKKQIQTNTWTRGVDLVRKIYIFYLSLSYITTTTSKRDLWKQADTKSFMTLAFPLNRESHDLTSLRNSKYIHTTYLPIFGIRVTDYYNKENSINCNRSIIIILLFALFLCKCKSCFYF